MKLWEIQSNNKTNIVKVEIANGDTLLDNNNKKKQNNNNKINK